MEGEHGGDGVGGCEDVGEELVFSTWLDFATAGGGDDGCVWRSKECASPGYGEEVVEVWMALRWGRWRRETVGHRCGEGEGLW